MDIKDDYPNLLVTWLPILTLLLLCFGILRVFIYYSLFNINILEYLDISEIVPLVLKDFIYSFIGLTSGYILGYLHPNAHRQNTVKKNMDIASNKINPFIRIYYYYNAYPILWIFVGALVLLPIVFLFKSYNIVGTVGLFFSAFIPLMTFTVPMEIRYLLKANRDIQLSGKSFLLVTLVVLATLFGTYQSVVEYVSVRYGHVNSHYSILINNKVIGSTNSYYYVGKTKSNVFFYNELNGKVDAYFSSAISKISF